MKRFGVKCTTTAALMAAAFLVFASPQGARGGDTGAGIASGAAADTNDANLAVFPWGAPQYTDGGLNCYPRPAWVLSAGMDGGLWITNDTWYGWQPGLGDWTSDLATNRLLIQFDRTLVSSNLWIAVASTGESNATLLAGFYDSNLLSVSDPITLHVTAAASLSVANAIEWRTNSIDLSQTPSASIISLFATNGMMRIFSTVLYRKAAVEQTAGNASFSTSPATTALSTTATTMAGLSPLGDPSAGGATALSADLGNAAVSGTAPENRRMHRVWYVNAKTGDDALYDGTADVGTGVATAGPRRTIAAVLAGATSGDTISVATGTYPGRVKLNGIRLVTNGRVVLQ
jgi:hypothetical protein